MPTWRPLPPERLPRTVQLAHLAAIVAFWLVVAGGLALIGATHDQTAYGVGLSLLLVSVGLGLLIDELWASAVLAGPLIAGAAVCLLAALGPLALMVLPGLLGLAIFSAPIVLGQGLGYLLARHGPPGLRVQVGWCLMIVAAVLATSPLWSL